MLIAEKFISGLVKIQDTWKTFGFNRWWNILPSSLHVLKPRSPHSFQLREKLDLKGLCNTSRTESEGFDDYFPCRKKNCKQKHVKQ